MSRVRLTVVLLALTQQGWTAPGVKQDAAEVATKSTVVSLKANTNLVQVPVVVRDARGRAVGALRAEDFRVTDDGKPPPAAFQALKESGRSETADAGTLLESIGALYIREKPDAGSVKCWTKPSRYLSAPPTPFLGTARSFYTRVPRYSPARAIGMQDLADALTIADRESKVEPAELRSLLVDYKAVLGKNHRRREAGAVEARIAGLGTVPADRVWWM